MVTVLIYFVCTKNANQKRHLIKKKVQKEVIRNISRIATDTVLSNGQIKKQFIDFNFLHLSNINVTHDTRQDAFINRSCLSSEKPHICPKRKLITT